MKRIIKLLFSAVVFCSMLLSLVGCSSSSSFTFVVSTGDCIKVTLDTSEGHALATQNGEFSVHKDRQPITDGIFMTEEAYTSYFNGIGKTEGITVIEEGTDKHGNRYIFYQYDEEGLCAWYCIYEVSGTATGIGLTNTISAESMRNTLELLTFTAIEVE